MILAKVGFSCGRHYLDVCGIVLAMEGDTCRAQLPERILPTIPEDELATATIGGRPIKDMPIGVVRFFRPQQWTEAMLTYVADTINSKAKEKT